MVSWSRKVWAAVKAKLAGGDEYQLVMLAVVLLGVYLRINGWLLRDISFWFDEAVWAQRVLDRGLTQLSIRPIGFMWVTRLLVTWFGATELWFRALPALGSIGALLLMPYVVSRLVVWPVLRVLVVLLFALQPALVDYANEFKPYSLEVFVHLVPIALYLRYHEVQRPVWLYALLGSLPLGFMFAYNLAFAFPGLLLLCLHHARRSADRKRLLLVTLAGGALCAAVAGGVYHLALRQTIRPNGETEEYWGTKYGVFYRSERDEVSRTAWTFEKYGDIAAFVGLRREYWSEWGKLKESKAKELRSIDRGFWILVSFAGLIALWQKRRDLLFVLFAPLLVLLLGNLAGKWPLGAFRTNLFTLSYTVPLLGVGLGWLAGAVATPLTLRGRLRSGVVAGLVLGLSVIPAFKYGFYWHGNKRTFTRNHYQREILDKLYQHRKRQLEENPRADPLPLYLEPHTFSPFVFYTRHHAVYSKKYGAFFDEHFEAKKVSNASLIKKLPKRLRAAKNGFWAVASARIPPFKRAATRSKAIAISESIGDDHFIVFMRKKR
jgi:hypothetical protein